MKFLCDQCKAKYQISDDKVAGKTVRMKCRKCGHLIEVRAAVTETSVTSGVPSEPPPAGPGAKPPPPKPAVVPKGSLATSLSQAKPPVPRPGLKQEGGLSNAFKSSMQTREDEAALLELSSADEWYAAINGVPVGPVRIGELRRKAALGAVTDDSLVWQEGMEEWRPVKTIPELAALVREAASSGRVSLVSPEPPNARGSVIPPAPSMRPGPQRPAPPRPASERPATAARSNVVPFASRLATAEKLEEAPAAQATPHSPTSERFSISPPADPFAVPPGAAPTAAVAVAAPPASAQAPVIVQMPRQPNYIGIGMILAMVMFGGVASWALFFKKTEPPPQPTVNTVYIHDPAAAAPAPVDTNAAPADSSAAGKLAHAGTTGSAKPGASAKALDLKGAGLGGLDLGSLAGGGGPSGPSAGPGSPLTENQISSVLNAHKIGLKRNCVERGGTLTGTANEHLSVTIDGTGHVTSAVADGNNPTIGTCIEKDVRAWVFPPTGAQTKVVLPFVFVAQ